MSVLLNSCLSSALWINLYILKKEKDESSQEDQQYF